MSDVQGKKIFVTGGSSGIGYAIAKLLSESGASVVIADIRDATEQAIHIGGHFVKCNVADEGSVAQALERASHKVAGKFDGVILNAGVGDVGFDIEQTEQALLEKLTKINQWGVLYGLKYAPQWMNDNGSIALTSSMASHVSVPGCGVYSAGKRALNSMAATSALELGARGIRINAVCPGYVDTELGNTPEEKRFSEMFTALGRHADPLIDVAPVFAFLMSDASKYITGQSIKVDGGMDLGPTAQLLQMVTGSSNSPGKS